MNATDRSLELSAICLARAHDDVRGPWTRATPIVLRQALEAAVTSAVAGVGVDPTASMRAKLLCLTEATNRATANEARLLWSRLSDACHYSAYQLDPTLDDITDWSARTLAVCSQLMAPTRAH